MAELDKNKLVPLSETNTIPLDATWVLPGSAAQLAEGYLPDARVFDVAALKAATPLGSRFPSHENIAAQANALGIAKDTPLLVYDRQGLFSAPFIQWSLQSAGHAKIAIVEGGLPFLKQRGVETIDAPAEVTALNGYSPSAPLSKGVIMSEVLEALEADIQIVDARGPARFFGTEPEPRTGLRSGHMPGAINLPLGSLLDESKRIRGDVENLIDAANIDLARPIITTCGSGVTASALRYIFEKFGARDVSVYLGSWSEWGASDAPIEV